MLLILVFLILCSSCGVKIDSERGLDVAYTDSSTGTPIILSSASIFSHCVESSDSDIIARIFTGSEFQAIPFKPTSNLISEIRYGGEIEIFESKIAAKRSKTKIIDKGTIFNICLGTNYSTEKSYQSAAASVLYSFNQIESKLLELNINLSAIKLKIAPNMSRVLEYRDGNSVVQDKKSLVNNAYYNSKDQEVVFLPQGTPKATGIIPFSGVPMWEIPFVATHEYGHHLFASLFPNYFNDTQIHSKVKLCFDNSHKHHRKGKSNHSHLIKNNSIRKIGLKSIVTVINEATADMFARYIVDEQITLRNLGCLKQSRDIYSKHFTNGSSKRLTSKALSIFFNKKKIRSSNCYRNVDYQDVHIIGASIAYMFEQALSQLKLSKSEKLIFLQKWIKNLNLKYYTYKHLSDNEILEQMVVIGLDTLKSSHSYSQAKTCALIGMNYPSLHHYYSCK